MPKIVLSCNNITKKIDNKIIINNLSLDLYEGDILGFIGPNGAGKTTTIKMILGLTSINKGTININGYDITKNFEIAIKNIGAIVENPDMYSYLTGYDNLLISAKLYQIKKERIDEVVKLVGLTKRINDKVRKYSLGMKQRLGIAQAILHKPKLLILDEPTNGLDPDGIKDLRIILKKLSKEGMAIIVSSHILNELETFVNKLCIIKNGQIIYNKTKKELNTNQKKYIIEINNINIKNIINEYKIIDSNHIEINTNKENIPLILKKLISKNINIYEIKEERKKLEEIFTEYTKGNTID